MPYSRHFVDLKNKPDWCGLGIPVYGWEHMPRFEQSFGRATLHLQDLQAQ